MLCSGKEYDSKKDLRLAIARDVIAQLHILNLKNMVYIGNTPSFEGGQELPKMAEVMQEECTVCALGACILSLAKVGDAIKKEDMFFLPPFDGKNIAMPIRNMNRLIEKLNEVFCNHQVDMIESAFEALLMSRALGHTQKQSDDLYVAMNFSSSKYDTETTLREIMENIIANDGEFCPQETVAKRNIESYMKAYRAANYTEETQLLKLQEWLKQLPIPEELP